MSALRRLVLGTLPLCRSRPADAYRLLDAFVAAGGIAVDTAALYGAGYVETVLGRWLAGVGPVLHVTTKVGYLGDPAAHRDPTRLRDAVERSVERLGTTPAAVLLHEADWACWWDPDAAVGDVGVAPAGAPPPAWTALVDLGSAAGFEVGVSGNNAEALGRTAAVLGTTRLLVAKQYDLLWRNAECLLADATLRTTLGAPFHQGRLLDLAGLARLATRGGDHELAGAARRLREVLATHSVTPAEVAVPFALADERAEAVCVGIADEAELRALVASAGRVLDPRLLQALRAGGIRRPPLPGPALTPEYLTRRPATRSVRCPTSRT
jgi:aryl-alcohol dehydrogenase-like predicted oxidoreductase